MEEVKFKHIIIKELNDKYSLGKFDDFTIIIMNKNQYVNATKLCNQINTKIKTKKRFRTWLENKSTKELVDYVSQIIKIPVNKLFIKIINDENRYTGTYIHTDLIMHVITWISPKYASDIKRIENYKLQKKMKTICKDRVIKSIDEGNYPCFILLKDNSDIYYHIIRTKNKTKNVAIKKHEDCSIVLNIKYNPNSINLLDRMRENLYDRIKIKGCSFHLLNYYTEKELIEDIIKLNNEKYDY